MQVFNKFETVNTSNEDCEVKTFYSNVPNEPIVKIKLDHDEATFKHTGQVKTSKPCYAGFYQEKLDIFTYDDVLVALHDLSPTQHELGVILGEKDFTGIVQLVNGSHFFPNFQKYRDCWYGKRLQEFDLRAKIMKVICPFLRKILTHLQINRSKNMKRKSVKRF